RAGAVAQPHSGPPDARQRAGMRNFRFGFGIICGDTRDGCEDRAAGAEAARLRRNGVARLARGGRHARHSHSAIDHDGGLSRRRQCLDHPDLSTRISRRAANVSVIQTFLVVFLPGLLVMALYSGYIAIWSLVHPEKTPPPEPQMSLREKLHESKHLIPLTLLILLVFISLMLGWATATECAAWGVLGSLAIAWWYKEATLECVCS